MSMKDFTLSFEDLSFVGADLHRPESVLAFRDDSLWCSDNAEGIITKIAADGTQSRQGAPEGDVNGIALDRAGDLVFANWSAGSFSKMSKDGKAEVFLDNLGGKKIHWANFAFADRRGGLWLSVSSMNPNFGEVLCATKHEGCIVKVDEKGTRVVAEGVAFANECRLDADERFLYVVETTRRRIVRYPVLADGGLGPVEPFGPTFGGISAMPDGIAFDAEGNLWVALVFQASLVVLTPKGELHRVFDFRNVEATERADAKARAAPASVTPDDLFACAQTRLPLPTSVAFGGPDLKTVYLGSMANSRLATFRSPVAGLPLVHQ